MKTCNFIWQKVYTNEDGSGPPQEAVYAPGHNARGNANEDETNHGVCACGCFLVSDKYHWHTAGICHNRNQCIPLESKTPTRVHK